MAGAATAPDRHRGIQKVYFNAIRARGVQGQVLVCNVTNGDGYWSHEDVVKGYAYMITRPAPGSCPSGFLGWRL